MKIAIVTFALALVGIVALVIASGAQGYEVTRQHVCVEAPAGTEGAVVVHDRTLVCDYGIPGIETILQPLTPDATVVADRDDAALYWIVDPDAVDFPETGTPETETPEVVPPPGFGTG